MFSASTLSLRLNSFWLLIARLTTQGLAVAFIALVARRLEPASFGQFTFIATIVFIGNTFTSFGTDSLLIREVARSGQIPPLVHRALTLQLVLSALFCFALIMFRVNAPLLIYSLSLFPLAIFSIVSALLRGLERMDLFWGISVAIGLLQILFALFASDLLTLCILLLIGNSLTSFIAMRIFSFLEADSGLLPLLDFRPLLPIALPFAALTIFSVILQRLGILSIWMLINDTATGQFSSAARILDGMKFGHYAVLGALLPMISRGSFRSQQNYRLAFTGLFVLSILLAGVAAFFARPILLFLFGEEYISAVDILGILAWCIVPYTISAFISVDLVARGKETLLLRSIVISLLVSIVLYSWCIISFGVEGASWAALGGEIFQAVVLLLVRSKSVIESEMMIHKK
ncbi:MAG TPA: oligosaccharide flippase family protein [Anaerolineales bacterium]|nr:oligosaccharide flippase family protein [Anaerolineales bacterium]